VLDARIHPSPLFTLITNEYKLMTTNLLRQDVAGKLGDGS
jgi:hypothetical protein